jgi:hypothetical protein
MLTQIWLAHPTIRNEYMVLDPVNWDNVPQPLVSNDIFKPAAPVAPVKPATKQDNSYLPWEV